MRLPKTQTKLILFTLGLAAVLAAVVYYAWPNSTPAAVKNSPKSATNVATPAAGFNKSQYPLDQASSLWVVVNKGRALPSSYIPANLVVPDVPLRLSASSSEMHLRADSAAALSAMFTVAKAQGINLMLASGYRSYTEQVSVYGNFAQQSGVAQADTYSARPGHSEHQTGLAADIEPTSRYCEVDQCFGGTTEGKWLAANCYDYGFIIRYRPGTQNLTGYEDEPWHVRYVGQELAAQIKQSDQTLEQFFGLTLYPDYPAQSLTLKT